MKTISVMVAFCFYGTVLGFSKNINEDNINRCSKRDIRTSDLDDPDEFIKPFSFIDISILEHNEAKSNEILRTKFFYKGKADFSVAVSQFDNSEDLPFFQTVVAFKTNSSAIFYETVESTSETPFCNKVTDFSNMFSVEYFEELVLIVTKDGVLSWYIPNQKAPFLRCTDPALKNIRFISFSGFNSRDTDVYYADCPLIR